mgnify:CR=1 FL=1
MMIYLLYLLPQSIGLKSSVSHVVFGIQFLLTVLCLGWLPGLFRLLIGSKMRSLGT